jgi:hypothetical protein
MLGAKLVCQSKFTPRCRLLALSVANGAQRKSTGGGRLLTATLLTLRDRSGKKGVSKPILLRAGEEQDAIQMRE